MQVNTRISELLNRDAPLVSVEFFPPKNDEGGEQILRTAEAMRAHVRPDFVSITYGAGGSTRERTFKYACLLKDEFGFEVMPHLTCVGATRDELNTILQTYHDRGFRNIMALRGDPPKGEEKFVAHKEGLSYGSDLVKLIRENYPDFSIGVGGYPEKHVEAPDMETDLRNLVTKVNAGACFITTQLFFDNKAYFRFVDQCRERGVQIPVVPGLLPVVSLAGVKRFCDFCGATLPRELEARLEACRGEEQLEQQVGVDWAVEQMRELIAKGAPGVHLYILNRSQSAVALVDRLNKEGILKNRQ